MPSRSRSMKLLTGAIAYLAVVAALVVGGFAILRSIDANQPRQTPVLAMTEEDSAARRERALDEVRNDPDRVPVWIVPTTKYEYTPVAIDPRPKLTPGVIGSEARGAMASVPNGTARERSRAEGRVRPPVYSSRDSDPFFRD
jgi:hypothetical protein